MLAHQYQVLSHGWSSDRDPESQREKRIVSIHAIAKRDRDSDFEVFNELLAMRLGQLVGLPIPAGMVVSDGDANYFASCHILGEGEDLPEADLKRFANDKPREACGVVVFDGWIANEDRHNENLWYDYYGDEFFMFDHGNSLLCDLGQHNLHCNRDRLVAKTGEFALSNYLVSFSWFSHWYDKIMDVPVAAIRQAVQEAAAVGVDSELAVDCANWLIDRRNRLPDLFRQATADFPSCEPCLFDPFGVTDDIPSDFVI